MTEATPLSDRITSAIGYEMDCATRTLDDPETTSDARACARQVLRAAKSDRRTLDILLKQVPWPKCRNSFIHGSYWFHLAARYGVEVDPYVPAAPAEEV